MAWATKRIWYECVFTIQVEIMLLSRHIVRCPWITFLILKTKKKLVKDVHWLTHLCMKLNKSNEDGVFVHNGLESSQLAYIKAKQDIDPT